MLKILFAGTPEVAVPSLQALAADTAHCEIVAVLTRPDAPTGRGRKLMPSPVKQAALELGLPVLESDPSEPAFLDELRATGAQAAAVIAYGKILKQSVLDALPLGWYNLHFSLLPHWRGAAPVQRAIWAGDDITGTTVFRITRAMDAGPMLSQSTTRIGEHETAGELLHRLAIDGARVLVDALKTVDEGTDHLVEQASERYPLADKISVEDAHIVFAASVEEVDRQIRACTPNPGAWCYLHAEGEKVSNAGVAGVAGVASATTGDTDAIAGVATNDDTAKAQTASGVTLHVLRAAPAVAGDPKAPQDLAVGCLAVGKRNVWIGTASGPLELLEVKAQGKKAMRAADWARGARLAEGAYCD